MAGDHFTPTEQRFLALLSDGLPHDRRELHSLLWDEYSELSAIQVHLSNIRKRLRPRGEDIICELHARTIKYRWVRLIQGASTATS
jgi:DNA-binding response OmpR family regulator